MVELDDDVLSLYPAEPIDRVVQQAAYDAGLTAHALAVVGLASPPGKTRSLPREFLLELGAALRLMVWELDGLDLQELGLPTAQDAITGAFLGAVQQIRDPSYPASSLSRTVLEITIERFAWAGPRELQAEIMFETPDEDALVEAMARLLWDHRGTFATLDGGGIS